MEVIIRDYGAPRVQGLGFIRDYGETCFQKLPHSQAQKTRVQGLEIASFANGLFRLTAVPYLSLGGLGYGLPGSLGLEVRGRHSMFLSTARAIKHGPASTH